MELQYESRTLILYESPHRVIETLQDMQTAFSNEREVVIARESLQKSLKLSLRDNWMP